MKRSCLGGLYVPGATRPTVVAVSPAGAASSPDDGAASVTIDALNSGAVGFASPERGGCGTRGPGD